MLFMRAVLFTILVPGTVAGYLPYIIAQRWPDQFDFGIVQHIGLLLITAGVLLYGMSTFLFLTEGKGTPAIWFTKPLRAVLGEEPQTLVLNGLYQRTRNPMYLGVIVLVLGEAFWFGKKILLPYTVFLWVFFHFIIILVEEPHLRHLYGTEYETYSRTVPQWIGFRKRSDEKGHET